MRRLQKTLCVLFACCSLTGHATDIGIAAFNIAWAGSELDFAEHVRVCTSPTVNWCDTRAKIARGARLPTPEEAARAKQCQIDFDAAAGGARKGLLVAPCNAYKLSATKWKKATPAIYVEKLEGLRKTVDKLIRSNHVDVIAFQEVRSAGVILTILGSHASNFEACVADHTSFQTVGFAWRRSLTSKPGKCAPEKGLAIKESPGDPASLRFLRPGVALSLWIDGEPVTLMNVHLKSSCANLNYDPPFEGHKLTDPAADCQVLNRQVAPLEAWTEEVAKASPLFVLLGDFNRRLDEEAAAAVPTHMVRLDGSDPSTTNKTGPNGEVASSYLWQELSDSDPSLVQILLSASSGCTGLKGLDHILISEALSARQTALLSSEKLKVEEKEKQVIQTSDHCPRVTRLSL